MVSPGYWSFWGRPESRSRRASSVDTEKSYSHIVAARVPHGGGVTVKKAALVRDDDSDHHKNGGNRNKNMDTSTCTPSSSSQESPTSQQPTTASTSLDAGATSSTSVPVTPTVTNLAPTAATTVWLTTSEWSTVTSIQTATGVSTMTDSSPSSSLPAVSTGLFRGQSDDGDDDCFDCHKHHKSLPPNNNKFAIAFGTLGGVGFLVGFLWLAFFIYRWRKKRNQNTLTQRDYASTIGKPSPFNVQWPFGRPRIDDGIAERERNSPSKGPRRSDTSIMDEAMRGAYGREGSSLRSVPYGYLDEKRQDPNYPLPVLDPAPIEQASLRKSIANWFRRSNSNHPLKLSPNTRWSRSTTRSSSFNGLSRITTAQSDDPYSASIYSTYTGGAPPVPGLDLQRSYTVAATAVAGPVELAAPVPAYTSQAAAAAATAADPPESFVSPMTPTASRWSRSTSGHERMSSVSTLTDATQTTISGGRESVPTMSQDSGLSPPGFHRPGGSKDLGMNSAERDTEELTKLREELLELYTQGARPEGMDEGKKWS